VRIVLFDFWPRAARYQREIFWAVMVVFLGIMIPVTFVVLGALAHPPLPH
jgi:uncharacterized membrane protein YhaH (DUF805 family)